MSCLLRALDCWVLPIESRLDHVFQEWELSIQTPSPGGGPVETRLGRKMLLYVRLIY